MDQGPRPRATDDPAINAILARVASLDERELVELARRYEATRLEDGDGVDRRRVLKIARDRDRAQRGDVVRELEVAVATALQGIGPGLSRQALLRLGILDTAERAILDAVLAIALQDRLGAEMSETLRRPWASVA